MKREIANIACSWISLGLPAMSLIKDTLGSVHSIAEGILFQKLYDIMSEQDSDFDEWLKISEKLEEDSAQYQKMVRQIIYNINAINEIDMLHAYSNLLQAYKNGLICKDDFFRLGFCLTKLLSQDAQFLKDNIQKDRIEENIYCISLTSNNLMYNQTRGIDSESSDEEKDYYCFTDMGKKLYKYALSYPDFAKYRYNEEEDDLSKQKLSYSYIKTYKGDVSIKEF